ncbi:uncharacterized protein Dvar_10530 [Desulfosarcina variabilis str. Montpellier]|uniref:hypothetical protein n=1 Tax=Desulfosarcina variabilis TaxID=2300 RepID=UPI003AFAE012
MHFLLSLILLIIFSDDGIASFQSVEEVSKWMAYYHDIPKHSKNTATFNTTTLNKEIISFLSVEEVAKWVTYYYNDPEPVKIPEAFIYMSQSGEINKDSDIPPFAGFLAGVLKNNPDKAESWIEVLSDLPVKHKRILIMGVWYSELPDAKQKVFSIFDRDNVLKQTYKDCILSKCFPCSITQIPLEQGPWVLDTLWGNFMATGSSQPVARIITALSLFDIRLHRKLLKIAAAAKWSLISNSKQHERVLKICIEQIDEQPVEIADELKEIIQSVNTELSHTK